MDSQVIPVRVPLINEYGSGYGELWLLFARTPDEIDGWIADNLDGDDGMPYYERDILDQCRIEPITVYDQHGNLTRSPWWTLLEQFATKDIGPSILKKIARLMPQ